MAQEMTAKKEEYEELYYEGESVQLFPDSVTWVRTRAISKVPAKHIGLIELRGPLGNSGMLLVNSVVGLEQEGVIYLTLVNPFRNRVFDLIKDQLLGRLYYVKVK